MSKFFDFGDISDDDLTGVGESTWWHIKARDMAIFQPDGKVITFWLWGDSESDIKNKLGKDIKDIEWIRKETPSFA
tara:strand:+ start:196 stop:423 length:228 start_codon:yes stop_codon:yes gene_type:complete